MNWSDADIDLRKQMVFVLLRAQKALVIDARPFYVLNYESFIAVYSKA